MGLLIVVAIGAWLIRERGPGLLPLGLLGILLIVSYTRWLTRSPALCLLAPGIAFGPLMVLGTYFALTGRYAWTLPPATLLALLTTPLAVRIYRGLARHHADVESLLPFMGQNVLLTLLTPLLLAAGLVIGGR